jgi:EAL domain-containing protein (putative c-di-GMP-specific phosphodiesterase class I)
MAEKANAGRVLEMDFRSALVKEEFELHYQPFFNLKSLKIGACEALVRWKHPVRGIIPPSDIIKVAEETGLMSELGRWVLNQACAECAKWPEHIAVAVNMSPTRLQEQDVIVDIRMALEASGLSPHRLNIEITERSALDNTAKTHEILKALCALGIKISLDDFGTGFSSLIYLH